ncbi:MAG: twin transmembrane helix small protein [Geminicoccaceae bacterium]|nr:MAG: twin transmembrane helix small protein [Geminicoccaceae bacterium]
MMIFAVLTVAWMVITAVVLIVGIAGFYRGGAFDQKYGNLMMRARVVSQGITVLFLVLFLLTRS